MRKRFELTKDVRSSNKTKAALAWAKFGFKIIPLHGIVDGRCTCGKSKCDSAGKHPISSLAPNGEKSGTSIARKIRRWFKDHPDANIGGVIPEGLVVVDIDGPKGRQSIDDLGTLPTAFTNRTGRGEHRFFQGYTRTRIGFLDGIDVKAGGYIVLPPSRHISGKTYRASLTHRIIPSLPAVFINKPSDKDQRSNSGELILIRKGARDDTLFRYARYFREIVDDEDTILEMLHTINRLHCSPPLSDEQVEKCVRSASNYNTMNEEYFGSMADVEPASIEWLWYPYIPRHGLTLLAGDPGKGKSFLTMDLTSRISNGTTWPFSIDKPHGNNVLILSSEDDAERAMAPRLAKLGAKMENIRYMKKFRKLDQSCLAMIEKEVADNRTDALFVDTISSYMGGSTDMNKQTEVQDFLVQLSDLAMRYDLAVIIVAHLNKKSGETALLRINGSIGFTAGVRSVLILGNNPEDKDCRVLAHVKSNWGEIGPSLIFELCGGSRTTPPKLSWTATSKLTANDVCESEKRPAYRPPVQGPQAEKFLMTHLAKHESLTWKSIVAAGKIDGHSKKTLENARSELADEGLLTKRRDGRSVYWLLVQHGSPKANDD